MLRLGDGGLLLRGGEVALAGLARGARVRDLRSHNSLFILGSWH